MGNINTVGPNEALVISGLYAYEMFVNAFILVRYTGLSFVAVQKTGGALYM